MVCWGEGGGGGVLKLMGMCVCACMRVLQDVRWGLRRPTVYNQKDI